MGSDWFSHGQDAAEALAARCGASGALGASGAWVAAPALATGKARTAASATGSRGVLRRKRGVRAQSVDHFIVMCPPTVATANWKTGCRNRLLFPARPLPGRVSRLLNVSLLWQEVNRQAPTEKKRDAAGGFTPPAASRCEQSVSRLVGQASSRSPFLIPAANARHCRVVKTRAGPPRSLESRTATAAGDAPAASITVSSRAAPDTGATSTQLPFAPL